MLLTHACHYRSPSVANPNGDCYRYSVNVIGIVVGSNHHLKRCRYGHYSATDVSLIGWNNGGKIPVRRSAASVPTERTTIASMPASKR
jgi:hypothetical protein